jgi:DNA ligase-associated metallophosphoesterase
MSDSTDPVSPNTPTNTEPSDDDTLMAQLQEEFSFAPQQDERHDYAGTCVHAVNGVELVTDASGVAYWPAEDTLLVADLHLEKGSSFARRGMLIPPYDTTATLRRFSQCLDKWQPRRVIALGDSFHDAQASERLSIENLETLKLLMRNRDWVWITGNHDPTPPVGLGGDVVECLRDGNLVLLHEPKEDSENGEISGHLHPKALLLRRGRRVSRSCFAADKRRMIMPSFGAYTGGLNVFDKAFENLFEAKAFHALMRGDNQIYRIPASELRKK